MAQRGRRAGRPPGPPPRPASSCPPTTPSPAPSVPAPVASNHYQNPSAALPVHNARALRIEEKIVLEWFDTHSGRVLALATFVLAVVTAYLAWTTRALVSESHTSLQAAARATLQARMDRISEIFIRE